MDRSASALGGSPENRRSSRHPDAHVVGAPATWTSLVITTRKHPVPPTTSTATSTDPSGAAVPAGTCVALTPPTGAPASDTGTTSHGSVPPEVSVQRTTNCVSPSFVTTVPGSVGMAVVTDTSGLVVVEAGTTGMVVVVVLTVGSSNHTRCTTDTPNSAVSTPARASTPTVATRRRVHLLDRSAAGTTGGGPSAERRGTARVTCGSSGGGTVEPGAPHDLGCSQPGGGAEDGGVGGTRRSDGSTGRVVCGADGSVGRSGSNSTDGHSTDGPPAVGVGVGRVGRVGRIGGNGADGGPAGAAPFATAASSAAANSPAVP